MQLAIVLTVFLTLIASVSIDAQTPAPSPADTQSGGDLQPLFAVGTSEWMATAGPAFGIVIFHSAAGHRYVLQSLSWGRILSRPVGPGALRGRFEWALELLPVYGQYEPDSTYGVGVTPLLWRWNFEPRGKLAPFAELAGGALFTKDPVPLRTTTANFTAHASYGVRYFFRPRTAFVASYRFHHISNGNRLERNPGVNAHVMQVGFSLLRPR
jgi:hypothetical protein